MLNLYLKVYLMFNKIISNRPINIGEKYKFN